MGTRSRIGVMHGDKCKSVYCHWDGYLAHNGRMLLDHYDSAKANHLVALGDLSVLAPEIGEKHPFSPHDLPEEMRNMTHGEFEAKFGNMCTFYGRDRGETGTDFVVNQTFAEFLEQCDSGGVEFYYIMQDGQWYCGTTYSSGKLAGQLVLLADALAEHDIEVAQEEEEEVLAA
jgi:hypothetical protein